MSVISYSGNGVSQKPTFTSNGVKEINTTKSSSNDRIDRTASSLEIDLSITTAVGENVAFSHLNQSQLTVVAVGIKV